MNINRLKQLEKKLSKKLGIVDEWSKWRFPIVYSTMKPGVYFLTKWEDGKFIQVKASKEEVAEYNKGVIEGAVFLPEEQKE